MSELAKQIEMTCPRCKTRVWFDRQGDPHAFDPPHLSERSDGNLYYGDVKITDGPFVRRLDDGQSTACGHRYPDGALCSRPRGHEDDPEHASSCSRAITEPSEPRRYAGCPIPTCCGVTMRIAELVDAVECVTCKRVVTALELIAERDAEWDRISTCEQWQSVDPLDVEYEGATLRKLLQIDLEARQEIGGIGRSGLSPYQRAVVSAHWSAELRSRVAAAKAKDRERVVLDADPEDP